MRSNSFIRNFSLLMILMLFKTNCCFSQKKLTGRSFSMLYGTSCKEFSDGGCIIQIYCSLKFDKKTVTVSYCSEAQCTAKENEKLYEKSSEKVYEWYTTNNVIHFRNFDDFGTLAFSNDGNLIGKRFPSDKANNLEFIEDSK